MALEAKPLKPGWWSDCASIGCRTCIGMAHCPLIPSACPRLNCVSVGLAVEVGAVPNGNGGGREADERSGDGKEGEEEETRRALFQKSVC